MISIQYTHTESILKKQVWPYDCSKEWMKKGKEKKEKAGKREMKDIVCAKQKNGSDNRRKRKYKTVHDSDWSQNRVDYLLFKIKRTHTYQPNTNHDNQNWKKEGRKKDI